MSTGAVRMLAEHVGRRLRARAQPVAPPSPPPYVPLPQAPRGAEAAEGSADPAELDSLRGALVRELDRLAAGDETSAGFRRA